MTGRSIRYYSGCSRYRPRLNTNNNRTMIKKKKKNVFRPAETVAVRAVAHRDEDDVDSVASSAECTICAYYSRTSDVPGAAQNVTRLPLSLAYDAVCPTPKSTDFSWSSKISVDESPVPLGTLFKGNVCCNGYNAVGRHGRDKRVYGLRLVAPRAKRAKVDFRRIFQKKGIPVEITTL